MSIRELQLYKLNILRDISQLCNKHDIKYVLTWGTLLGAIRHSGFIPWDDDVDIAIPWDDYNRFIKLAKAELPEKYFVQNYLSDPAFPMMYTQIRVNNTTSMPVKSSMLNIHWGVCIDVFPLIGVCDTEKGFAIQRKLIGLCNSFLITDYMKAIKMEATGMQKLINLFPRFFRRTIVRTLQYIILMQGRNAQNLFCLENPDIRNQGSRANWTERIPWEFEGEHFWVPKAYDEILTREYGDYMTPPPLDMQGGHELILGDQIIDLTKDYTHYQKELLKK